MSEQNSSLKNLSNAGQGIATHDVCIHY
jgi:hypothetical protein